MSVTNSLVFANARIKALESNLLTADKITRMVDSSSLEEAVKVLAESNYGGGMGVSNPKLFDQILLAEEKNTANLIRTLVPEGYGVECFLLRNDYHNAKVFVKAKYSSIKDIESILKPYGTIEIEALKEGIASDNYSLLPNAMKKALEEIDLAFVNGKGSPKKIDVKLDLAMFENIFDNLTSIKGSIKEYFVKLVDLTNIATMMRSKKANLNLKAFEEGYINGGTIDIKKLGSLYECNTDTLVDTMKYSEYKDAFLKLLEDRDTALIKYEIYMDNLLLSIFKKERYNMFSPSPIVGYYLGKLTEIKMAKLVLVCINNDVDKKIIRQRLRDLYA